MDENRGDDAGPGRSPLDEAENVSDSAVPGRKPIDDTSESSKERRAHPGRAEEEDQS
jgi:hypothetical protein